jgi:hypothetical protein
MFFIFRPGQNWVEWEFQHAAGLVDADNCAHFWCNAASATLPIYAGYLGDIEEGKRELFESGRTRMVQLIRRFAALRCAECACK